MRIRMSVLSAPQLLSKSCTKDEIFTNFYTYNIRTCIVEYARTAAYVAYRTTEQHMRNTRQPNEAKIPHSKRSVLNGKGAQILECVCVGAHPSYAVERNVLEMCVRKDMLRN